MGSGEARDGGRVRDVSLLPGQRAALEMFLCCQASRARLEMSVARPAGRVRDVSLLPGQRAGLEMFLCCQASGAGLEMSLCCQASGAGLEMSLCCQASGAGWPGRSWTRSAATALPSGCYSTTSQPHCSAAPSCQQRTSRQYTHTTADIPPLTPPTCQAWQGHSVLQS